MLIHDLGIGLIGLIGQGKDNEPVLLLGWEAKLGVLVEN